MRATLAEVGGRLAEAGETVAAIGITNQRETLVAFDRSHAADPCTGPSSGRTGAPRRSAPSSPRRGTFPSCGSAPASCSTPTSAPPRRPGSCAHGELALGADDAGLSFCTVDSWVLWNLTGGADGGTYATDPSNASRTLLLDTATLAWSPELCDLFGVPAAQPARGAPVRRPLRDRRARRPRSRRPPCSTASRSRACWATSRPRSSGRPASSPAWSRSPTAPAASCSPTPGPSARRRPTA